MQSKAAIIYCVCCGIFHTLLYSARERFYGSSTYTALYNAAVADQIITFLVIIFIILQSKAAIIFYLLCVVVAIMTYEHHVMVFNHNNP